MKHQQLKIGKDVITKAIKKQIVVKKMETYIFIGYLVYVKM